MRTTAAKMSRKCQDVKCILFMLGPSVHIEADNQARVFRVQKDPVRATSCTLKKSPLFAGRK